MKPVDAVPEALAAPVAPGEEQFAGPPDLVARPDMLKARQGIRAQSRAKAEDMPVEPSEVQPVDFLVPNVGGAKALKAGAKMAGEAVEGLAPRMAYAGSQMKLAENAEESLVSLAVNNGLPLEKAEQWAAKMLEGSANGKTGLSGEFRDIGRAAKGFLKYKPASDSGVPTQIAKAAQEIQQQIPEIAASNKALNAAHTSSKTSEILSALAKDSLATPNRAAASEATNVAGKLKPEQLEKLLNHVTGSHEQHQSILDRLMNVLFEDAK
jgi:hypothetical protein